jgi:phosphatidylserine/phosphatidylglycerophosphate/cardiolipin synthase-like enzyme
LPSSPASAEDEPAAALGRFLTGTEAGQVATRLAAGETLTMALRVIASGRRPHARDLLEAIQSSPAGDEPGDRRGAALPVLRAIEGARSEPTAISPIWTMPGHLAQSGPLTSSVVHLVGHARQSVTCSTFNFQRSSALWAALAAAARQPGITVRVYLDATAAGREPAGGTGRQADAVRTPTPEEVAAHLQSAVVLQSRPFDGKAVRNHAKFLVVDHRFLLVTSANFSWSAENGNIEFGVLHDNRNLAESVEREMRQAEDVVFKVVHPVDQ